MKVKTNSDAFKGMTQWNGIVCNQDIDSKTKQPIMGISGETGRFVLTTGGCIYMKPDQYEVMK